MSGYPLVLAHPHVRRILERKATVLIFARKLPVGTREIHDSFTVRRNHRHRRDGRPELQEDPLALTIEVEGSSELVIVELDLVTVRAAGYRTTEDFYLDWLARRRQMDIAQAVHIHRFRIVEDAHYLHARVHRGYTSDPAQAAKGEPQALSRSDLDQLARRAAARQAREDELFRQRAKRSIGIRLKQAAQHGDLVAIQRAQAELTVLIAGTALAG